MSSRIASSSSDLMVPCMELNLIGPVKMHISENTPQPRHICRQQVSGADAPTGQIQNKPASSEVRVELTAEDIITIYYIWMDSI